MKPELFTDFLAFGHRLADLSGEAILPLFRNLDAVEDKSGGESYDPVTQADRAAEEVIRAEVARAWPEHGFRGEEFGSDKPDAEFCWLVDPIDGTRAFIHGLPVWGTLIALLHEGKPVLGLMNQPFTGERFWSETAGARYRGPEGERAIKTRSCGDLALASLSTTSPNMFASDSDHETFEKLSEKVRTRWFGGDCYGYCLLAAGHSDIVLESGLSDYDIAALIPIVEKAGGCITDWSGGSAATGGQVLACGDPGLHEQVLELLKG